MNHYGIIDGRLVIELENGKYTYIRDRTGQYVLRYGEPWRDIVGDKFILAMAHKIEKLADELARIAP